MLGSVCDMKAWFNMETKTATTSELLYFTSANRYIKNYVEKQWRHLKDNNLVSGIHKMYVFATEPYTLKYFNMQIWKLIWCVSYFDI